MITWLHKRWMIYQVIGDISYQVIWTQLYNMRYRRRRSELIGTNLPPINTHGDKAASYCCKFKKLQYTDFCIEKCSIQINFISNCNIINTHRVAIAEACTRLPIIIKTQKAAIYDANTYLRIIICKIHEAAISEAATIHHSSSARLTRQPFMIQTHN